MTDEDLNNLQNEIDHIMESGCNDVRLMNMFEQFFDRRVNPLKKRIENLQFMVDNGLGGEDLVDDITYPTGD